MKSLTVLLFLALSIKTMGQVSDTQIERSASILYTTNNEVIIKCYSSIGLGLIIPMKGNGAGFTLDWQFPKFKDGSGLILCNTFDWKKKMGYDLNYLSGEYIRREKTFFGIGGGLIYRKPISDDLYLCLGYTFRCYDKIYVKYLRSDLSIGISKKF